jgi:hypothetical protein
VEETQQTTPVGMDMDVPEGGQGQQVEDTGNHSHSRNPEEGLRVNGTVPNQEETTMPEGSHTTMLEQPQEGTVEDVIGRPDEYAEERTMEVGTSSQPPQWKGKQAVPRSPCRKATTTIILPRILEGVRIVGNMLGHVEKLRYSDHDVNGHRQVPRVHQESLPTDYGYGTLW